MLSADYCFSFIKFIARKNQFGEIQPSEYGFAVSGAQDWYYDFLIGRLEEFQMMKPVPRVALGQSIKISQILLPLKVANTSIAVVSGIAVYPPDFDYRILVTDTSGKNIPVIDDSKKPARLNSVIDPPSVTNGFCVLQPTGFEINPSTLTPVLVTYYKRPPASVWGYTVDSEGRADYDQSTSVNPVFNDTVMRGKVLPRAMKHFGFSFTEQDWVAYGDMVQKQGE